MALRKKWSFSIKDLLSKRDEIRMKLQILARFTEEILNGKLNFLCSVVEFEPKLTGALIDVLHFVQLANYLYCQERKKGKTN